MNNRQIEELAKTSFDLGKLTYGSLVLGFFQSSSHPTLILGYGLIGLTLATIFFIIGLQLFKEVK